jgi:hypothetical protein
MKMTFKAVLIVGVVLNLTADATAQISNNRDGNGNIIRKPVPTNTAPPMINSTSNRRPAQNVAPTADQNIAPWQRK